MNLGPGLRLFGTGVSPGWKWVVGALFLLVALPLFLIGNPGDRSRPAPDTTVAIEANDTGEVASAGLEAATAAGAVSASTEAGAANVAVVSEDPLIGKIRNLMNDTTLPAASAAASERRDPARETSWTSAAGRLLAGLGVVIAGIFAFVYIARRVTSGGSAPTSSHLKVVSKAWLSSRTSVYLVRVPGKTLVVGESPNGVTLLSEITDEALVRETGVEPDNGAEAGNLFRGALQRAEKETESSDLALKVRDSIAYFRDLAQRRKG